jgi:Lon protease-like protein
VSAGSGWAARRWKKAASPTGLCRISPFLGDLEAADEGAEVDRKALLESFKAYLDANNLEADWNSVERASTRRWSIRCR